MARTTSLAFPNMLDATHNTVSTLSDNASIVNRTRLLILSQPTSLYNSPTFGVGLEPHLFQYNTENEKAIIKQKIIDGLSESEPYVYAEQTQFADGLLFTGNETSVEQEYNTLKMTVAVVTKYEDTLNIDINTKTI